MLLPCISLATAEPPQGLRILNCGTTLEGTAHTLQIDWGGNYAAPARADYWISHPGINGGAETDISGSIGYPATTFTTNTAIPADGSTFTVFIRVNPDNTLDPATGFTRFDKSDEVASCTFTSAPAVSSPDHLALELLVVNSINLTAAKFDTAEMQTSTGGYHAWEAMSGLKMIQDSASSAANKALALATGVRMATDFSRAGQDLAGDALHTGTSYPQNGYKDWRYGQGSTPNRINHYHYEWRCMAMMGVAVLMIDDAGGGQYASEKAELLTCLAEVWDKYDRTVSAPNTPPVLDNRTLNFAIGGEEAARLSQAAIALDRNHSTPGNNKYFDYFNRKIPVRVQEYIDNGGYADLRTDPQTATLPTQHHDLSHANDELFAIALSCRYGYGYSNATFMSAIQNWNATVMNPPSRTDARFELFTDGQDHGGLNPILETKWGTYGLFLTDAHRDRLIADYLNNQPLRASHPETDLQNIGALCTALSGAYC